MKKVLSLATIMVMLLVVLTGCVDVSYEVTLNDDGTADVAYIYGFDKEYLEQMETTGEEMTEEMQQNAELSDYTVESYSNEKVEGFRATKHLANFSEISLKEAFGEEYVSESEENQIKLEKKSSKTIYSQKAEIDLTSMDESMVSMVTMKYTIKLPTKVGKNNASEVSKDGKTLTWNLKAGEVNKIEFEATELGTTAKIIKITVIALIALIIVAIIVAVITLIIKKVKNKNQEEDQPISEEKENKTSKEVIENSDEEDDEKDDIIEEETKEDNEE